jgi:hypothetical protein
MLRSIIGYLPGLCCLFLGLLQLSWIWWLVVNSLHMGSPLRLHGDTFLRSIADPAVRDRAESMNKVGLLGFDLLDKSMSVHFVCAAALLLLGLIMVISTRLQRTNHALPVGRKA